MNKQWSGGCVCGAIRFDCASDPERITVCHCRWCQRRTGTAFGTEVVFLEENVHLTGDAPARYRHVSDESGKWLDVYFCPRCGSNLGLALEAVPGIRSLPAGTFDDAEAVSAYRGKRRHVYARSRRNWGDLTSDVEIHEQHFRK